MSKCQELAKSLTLLRNVSGVTRGETSPELVRSTAVSLLLDHIDSKVVRAAFEKIDCLNSTAAR
jgi:hypothetical protein